MRCQSPHFCCLPTRQISAIWRKWRDSNPRGLAPKCFSRAPRYGHFDTLPYELLRFLLQKLSSVFCRDFRTFLRIYGPFIDFFDRLGIAYLLLNGNFSSTQIKHFREVCKWSKAVSRTISQV